MTFSTPTSFRLWSRRLNSLIECKEQTDRHFGGLSALLVSFARLDADVGREHPSPETKKESERKLRPDSVWWCARRDLNPYVIQHTPLKRACLPVPALALNSTKAIISFQSWACQPKTGEFLKFLDICARKEKSPRPGKRRPSRIWGRRIKLVPWWSGRSRRVRGPRGRPRRMRWPRRSGRPWGSWPSSREPPPDEW